MSLGFLLIFSQVSLITLPPTAQVKPIPESDELEPFLEEGSEAARPPPSTTEASKTADEIPTAPENSSASAPFARGPRVNRATRPKVDREKVLRGRGTVSDIDRELAELRAQMSVPAEAVVRASKI